MRLTKIAVCKLELSDEERHKLLATLQAFRDACNYTSRVAFEHRAFHPVALHHMVYRDTRVKSGLPANLAIRARDRVAKAYKQRRNRLLRFSRLSLDLDARLFRVFKKPEGWYASITTAHERVKSLLKIGKYQRKLLEGVKPTHVLTYRDGQFYLHITV